MVVEAVRYEPVSKIDENVGWAPEYIASIKEMAETSRTASTPILTVKSVPYNEIPCAREQMGSQSRTTQATTRVTSSATGRSPSP
jgi:hypothetical protein